MENRQSDQSTCTETNPKANNRGKTVAVVCGVIAVILLCICVITPMVKYNNALDLMEDGRYDEAIIAFGSMDGYKDSADKIEECYVNICGEELWNHIKSVNVGDIYTFGSYEQDNDSSNGQEDIEWLVLSKKGTRILVISKYALDYKRYDDLDFDITWESCALREWLNKDFVDAAFSAEEKAMIPVTTVPADKNPEYGTDPGNETQDRVFLLSVKEAKEYFTSESERACEPTAYAIANSTVEISDHYWWLRSPGYIQNYAAIVGGFHTGEINERGSFPTDDRIAVRPAMWIDLNA